MGKQKKHYKRKTFGRAIVSDIVKITDGDTFRCNLQATVKMDNGREYVYPSIIADNIPIRIRGVDTPELRGATGLQLEAAIESYMYLKRRLVGAELILLCNMSRDKYFRILADVTLDGVLLRTDIIRNGYGRPYRGGPKKPWTF